MKRDLNIPSGRKKYSFVNLVDLTTISRLLEAFYQATGFVVGVVDVAGRILMQIGYRDICTQFHRKHPECERLCIESDLQIARELSKGSYTHYTCANGLIDAASPIMIDGEHLATIYTGQFFFSPPDERAFLERAKGLGFDTDSYLQALREVPVVSRERYEAVMKFLTQFAVVLGEIGLKGKLEFEAQEALLHAQKLEVVGRLAGGVAHDFNNMLGVILGHVEMTLMEISPDQPIYRNLEEIKAAAMRSADLTRQLLAFARKQTAAPKVLDINKTVESMTSMLRRLIGEDIDLAWLPGKHVWSVWIDPAQVDQVLANLCVNARDAIAGMGKVTIETHNTTIDEAFCATHADCKPGEFVLLAVSDNGCGMDAETREKLFEPFFTTKEQGKGTGLGLATVHGVVKQNNGFINVYSEPGQGTTFKIYLPRHMAKAIDAAERKLQVAGRGSETILMVEDEPANLKITTMLLESLGYRVLAARTPGEAIRLCREHAGRIDLLLTDVVMPEMNGRDLAKNILSLYPDIRWLFMSGYTANVIAHHGVLDPGVHFLQKPFSTQDLGAKIREALGNG
jgi:signal transduction histidine kinase/CheY-like chemotaxis protein